MLFNIRSGYNQKNNTFFADFLWLQIFVSSHYFDEEHFWSRLLWILPPQVVIFNYGYWLLYWWHWWYQRRKYGLSIELLVTRKQTRCIIWSGFFFVYLVTPTWYGKDWDSLQLWNQISCLIFQNRSIDISIFLDSSSRHISWILICMVQSVATEISLGVAVQWIYFTKPVLIGLMY